MPQIGTDAGHRAGVPRGGGARRAGRRAAHGRPGGLRPGLHPRRRRHRQDPHDHPPHRLRRAHRRLRARAGARGDLHRAGGRRAARPAGRARRRRRAGPHLPRRGDAPAALLRAARARRPDARRWSRTSCGWWPRPRPAVAAVHRPHQPARPRQRDRVGEDDARHAGRLPGAGEGGRPGAAVRGRRGRRGLRQLRVGQAARRRPRLRGPAAGHRLRARGAPATSPARCAAQYRHFVVDEYQDVNPLQQRLLDAWLGGRAEVCVVGDPNQTIYSFTGADPDYLLGFADRYPDADVVKLERDYRSTPAGGRRWPTG